MQNKREQVVGECEVMDWYGAYREGWGDLLPSCAFAHP